MENPLWWKLLTEVPPEYFYHSKTDHKFYMNDNYNIIEKLDGNLYKSAADEVKEFNSYHRLNGNSFDKVMLGRKIASIPANEYFLHPELQKDPLALKIYLNKHPEFRADRYNKNHAPDQ